MLDISVVIPVYNSEMIVGELVGRISKTMQLQHYSHEIILVDDASSDASWSEIKAACAKYRFVSAYRLSKNSKQWKATLFGMSMAKGAYIVTIDDDLEYSPEDIPMLYNQIIKDEQDVIFGISPQKYVIRGKDKRLMKLRNRFLDFIWAKGPTDSFKILNRNLLFSKDVFLPNIHFEAFLSRRLPAKKWGYLFVNYNKRFSGNSNHYFSLKMKLFLVYHFQYRISILSISALLVSAFLINFYYLLTKQSALFMFVGCLIFLLSFFLAIFIRKNMFGKVSYDEHIMSWC